MTEKRGQEKILWHPALCYHCIEENRWSCGVCCGTNRDPIPWTELFPMARVDGTHRVR
jgi:hypothetical protein